MISFLRRYEGVIFDLDGTLADSMHVWDSICRDWLESAGCIPRDGLDEAISLMTLPQSADYIAREYTPNRSPAQILEDWNRMVTHRYKHDVILKPGAGELVRALAEEGMPMAVATSCVPPACEGLLRRYGLWDCFTAVVYSGDVGRDKTFPDIYLACGERLGVAPRRCVVLEDLYEASRGVRAAGMGLVAVYDASCKQWEALRDAADLAVMGFPRQEKEPGLFNPL